MELPWAFIDDLNIKLSHKEFEDLVKSSRNILEDIKDIDTKFILRSKYIYASAIISIIIFVVLYFSLNYFTYLSLLILLLSYVLGYFLSWLFRSLFILLTSILIVILAFIFMRVFLSPIIASVLIASIIPLNWSYLSNLNSELVFATSSYATNLLVNWDDIKYVNEDDGFSVTLRRGNARVNPYRADMSITISLKNKEKINAEVIVFALTKGRIGYIIKIKVKKWKLFDESFKNLLAEALNELRGYINELFNSKEWELG
ncbi:MAG: hypothetical protein RXR59_04495 [Sulfolobus sp.]